MSGSQGQNPQERALIDLVTSGRHAVKTAVRALPYLGVASARLIVGPDAALRVRKQFAQYSVVTDHLFRILPERDWCRLLKKGTVSAADQILRSPVAVSRLGPEKVDCLGAVGDARVRFRLATYCSLPRGTRFAALVGSGVADQQPSWVQPYKKAAGKLWGPDFQAALRSLAPFSDEERVELRSLPNWHTGHEANEALWAGSVGSGPWPSAVYGWTAVERVVDNLGPVVDKVFADTGTETDRFRLTAWVIVLGVSPTIRDFPGDRVGCYAELLNREGTSKQFRLTARRAVRGWALREMGLSSEDRTRMLGLFADTLAAGVWLEAGYTEELWDFLDSHKPGWTMEWFVENSPGKTLAQIV